MMQESNVAIVGGGISGLTAAIYIAKAGYAVTVFEKSNQLGGRAMTIQKHRTMLNLGVHAFYQDGAGETVLKELDIPLKGANPSASAAAIWENKTYQIPTGPLQLLSDQLFSLSGKMNLAKLMMKLNKINTEKIGNISLQAWTENVIQDPMVRRLLYAISRSNSFVPYPELHVAGPALRQLQRTFSGKAFYIEKGWGTLIADLQEKAIQAGVKVENRQHVTKIECDEKVRRIHFSHANSEDVSHVLVTAGMEEACKLVDGAEHTTLAKWNRQARPAYAACLDLVLRRLPEPAHDFIAGFWLDKPIFYNNPTTVVEMSEGDSIVIHLVKHLGTSSGNPKVDIRHLEQAMSVVQPGWQREEISRQFLPQMIASNDFISIDRVDPSPEPAVPEVGGLYVAGDWMGHGELLADAALGSAKRAAHTIIQELKVDGIETSRKGVYL